MGCSSSIQKKEPDTSTKSGTYKADQVLNSSIIIQKWFRRYKAHLEIRRRCAWKIFQEIEYSAEQDQINLYNFFNEIVTSINNNGSYGKKFADILEKSDSTPTANITNAETEAVKNINSTKVENFYKGPHVTLPLELQNVHKLLEYFKTGQVLHAKYVKLILHEAKMKAKLLPNVLSIDLNITKQITIVGDLHGKLDDLFTIFHKNGLPSNENPYIFNGDFVDRGKFSIEILVILCCFYLLYPRQVVLNRGNHEDYIMNSRYGFTKEVATKYKLQAGKVKEFCREFFAWLPLATIIGNKILVAHGGLSDRTDLELLKSIPRNQFVSILKPTHISLEETEPPPIEILQEWEQVLDLLWSDPQPTCGKVFNKHRGGGCCFGPDVTDSVLRKHKLDLLIRSHECKFEGYEYAHNNKVLTVFSASSYYADGSNLGAYIKLDVNLTPRIVQFSATKENKINSFKDKVGIHEECAMKELKEKIHAHKSQLADVFKQMDINNTGKLSVSQWANGLEKVLHLKLPWTILRAKLVDVDKDGNVLYMSSWDGYKVNSAISQMSLLSETIYRNKQALETVFRIIDKDCSGFISTEEMEEACHMLNKHTNGLIPESGIQDLAKTLDINKDGKIDFNEFLEAFRLVTT
ncbi:serine/threonine-protein phosphatase with EF-hands 2-like [Hydractinia symbiolongicarpus]|uniref:serine/threonine-protein phosphatase with EF-hands 2-like n=1 Tax=Hydractinia symbiolongicarpus TaxID=13093 RepID=UPI0025500531|nr:serine/threonine-protein phosphatase with EF-hands 2-like [Hydractinia symbiolongicarpus]